MSHNNNMYSQNNNLNTIKYIIPRQPYQLYEDYYPLYSISYMTDGLNQLDEKYKGELINKLLQRNGRYGCMPTIYGEYTVPSSVDTLKMIVGIKGHYFKLTTTTTGVDLIWHNRENNKFCFWGPSYNTVNDAMNRIRSRIVKYTVYMTPPPNRPQTNPPPAPMKPKRNNNNMKDNDYNSSDNEDYSDMPELISCEEELVNKNCKRRLFDDVSGGCFYNA